MVNFEELTIEEKIGQLFLIGVKGKKINDEIKPEFGSKKMEIRT